VSTELTETAHTYWLGERLRLRLMVTLLILVGKCSGRWAKSAHVVSHLPVGLNEEKKSTVIFRDTPNEAHRYVRYQQVQGSGQNGQNSHTSGVPTFLLATELGPFCLRFCLVIVLFSAARYTHA